jgi:PBP1b-binding outer membrane lipoprotein LpoB
MNVHKMLIRLEQSFIELAQKVHDRFSEQDRQELSQAIEANYEKVRLVMLEQEKSKDKSKPTLLELGNIGSRFFAVSIHYNDDVDDVPISVRELIPTVSPVRLDLMTTTKTTKSVANPTHSSTADPNSTYLKAGQVYDDGSIKAKYYAEAIREDEGIRPPGHYD